MLVAVAKRIGNASRDPEHERDTLMQQSELTAAVSIMPSPYIEDGGNRKRGNRHGNERHLES
jgi:hypothetical protein